jgi:hypothetical protein
LRWGAENIVKWIFDSSLLEIIVSELETPIFSGKVRNVVPRFGCLERFFIAMGVYIWYIPW